MSDTPKYKTKADRQREAEERIDAALPSVDIGQFCGVTPRSGTVDLEVEVPRALAVARRMVYGAPIRDACLIEGAKYSRYQEAIKAYRAHHAKRMSDVKDHYIREAREGTWFYALGFTLDRASAICRLRWQQLAEAGGKGSKAALFMLERRGGREFLPAVRREQVTTTTTTNTNTNTTLTLEAKLEATRHSLGFSDEHLAQMGEWLAKAQTAAQRGDTLPAPPVVKKIEAHPHPEGSAPLAEGVIDVIDGDEG